MVDLSTSFNETSASKSRVLNAPEIESGKLPFTDFANYLNDCFSRHAALKVMQSFKKMNITPPEDSGEFLAGTEGALVFLNKYGLVIRIESKTPILSERVPDEEVSMILKPIASIDMGKAIFEICPALAVAENSQDAVSLTNHLKNEGINFWDDQLANIGILPIKMPNFPEGVPVVIDRLAVEKLSGFTGIIKTALGKEVEKAQAELYMPLSDSFISAWNNLSKMDSFWQLCEKYVAEGKLVVGWNNKDECSYSKTPQVREIAKIYAQKL